MTDKKFTDEEIIKANDILDRIDFSAKELGENYGMKSLLKFRMRIFVIEKKILNFLKRSSTDNRKRLRG